MKSAILNYDDFDLENETEDRYDLPTAIQRAELLRKSEPDFFIRLKPVGTDKFIIKKVPVQEVYSDWTDRIQRKLAQMLRKRAAR